MAEDFVPFIRPDGPDASFWKENYENNSWDCPMFAPNDFVIDLGAGVGSFTRRAWKNGSRSIGAYEIDPDYYEVCKKNLEGCKGISLYNQAVLAADGIGLVPYHRGSCALWSANTSGELLGIPIKAFDDIVGISHVRFLKMNVEGAEWGILYL